MIPKLPDDHKTGPDRNLPFGQLAIDERVPRGAKAAGRGERRKRERERRNAGAGSSMIISRRHLSRQLSQRQIVDYHRTLSPVPYVVFFFFVFLSSLFFFLVFLFFFFPLIRQQFRYRYHYVSRPYVRMSAGRDADLAELRIHRGISSARNLVDLLGERAILRDRRTSDLKRHRHIGDTRGRERKHPLFTTRSLAISRI